MISLQNHLQLSSGNKLVILLYTKTNNHPIVGLLFLEQIVNLSVYLLFSFAQESLSDTVRLNTMFPSVESGSTQK